MTPQEKKQLQVMACKVRMGVIEGVHAAKSGHPGGSLSAADMFTYLYFKELRVDPENPQWEDRDRFVLSKGHTAPGLYAALALRGFFPVEDLVTLRKMGSVACGMALASRLKKRDNRVYTLLGDGEIQEGQVWEACMFAAHYKLDNLCVIIDNNGLQIDGDIAKVMSPYPIDKKLEAFGFHVETIDGHDFDAIASALDTAKTVKGQPSAIIMKTVKGKGVSFMENQASWHGSAPNDEQYAVAMAELKQQLSDLEGM